MPGEFHRLRADAMFIMLVGYSHSERFKPPLVVVEFRSGSRMLHSMLLFALASSGVPIQEPLPLQPVADVRMHRVDSECVGDRYLVRVGLPDGYDGEANDYPVVVVLDAEKSFGLVRDVVDWLSWNGTLPEALVVGVSYGTDTETWWDKRGRDLTPSVDESGPWGNWPQSGKADSFRQFIRDDLAPLIESKYRVRPDWTLVGLSFGGLFATYDMFHQDRLFDRYVIVSPAYPWDDGEIFDIESSFAASHDSLPVRVFTALGEHDGTMREAWRAFNDRVEEHDYAGLSYTEWLAPDETHISVFPGAVSRGLAAVFAEGEGERNLAILPVPVAIALAFVLAGSGAVSWYRRERRR